MKKSFFSTMRLMGLALLAAATLVTACEEVPEEIPSDGKLAVNITGVVKDYNNSTSSFFEKGDAVGLHIITDHLYADNAKFTYSADGKFTNMSACYWYEDKSVLANLIAYYPFNFNDGKYNENGFTFSVGEDQSTNLKYRKSDFLVGYASSKPTAKAVNMTFRHVLSQVVLPFNTNGEIIKEVVVSGVATTAKIKVTDGSCVADASKKSTILPAKVTIGGKDAWAFIAVPQSNAVLRVEVLTESNNRYSFENVSASFEAGKAYTATELTLEDPDAVVKFTTTITDWVAENEGAMEFEKIENDVIIEGDKGVEDVDPYLEWPLIATLPSLISPEITNDFVVVVNTQGTSITPGEKLYAHTGVITSASSSGSDWKYVKHEWGVDADDCLLTHVGNGIYAMVITGGVRAFYEVPAGEEILQMAFVFRTSGGTKEVKDDGKDIYVNLVDASELVVSFVSPKNGEIVKVGDVVKVQVVAQNSKSVTLTLNGSEVESVESSKIYYEHTVSEVGDMVFEATAYGRDGSTVSESVIVAALGSTQSMSRPASAKEGVTVEGSDATFVLFAPGKEQIVLLGDFNKFAPSNEYLMYRDGDYFWTTVSGLQPNTEYAYQFLVDGTIRVGDPYCEKVLDPWNDSWINYYYDDATQTKLPKPIPVYPDLKEYPANATDVVSVFSTTPEVYNWQVTDFDRPNRHSLVIYELLVRDFTEEGSIDAVTAKLDYLETLGVNAIELLPIQEFDGNDSWGYNPCFYFAPDKAYGTKEDYKEFIDECHKRGIAVILDVVFNHTTGQFPWAKMWWNSATNKTAANNPFFNVDATHNWSVYHDLKHTYPKTRSYIKEVLQFWLREYNIDGYRFDLTKGIVQNPSNYDAGGYSAERIGWLKEYADAIRSIDEGEDAYIIFEHFCDSREENELAAYKEIQLWNNSAMSAMQESAMGWHDGGKSNFSGISTYGRVSFAESHDEERVAYKMSKYGDTALKTVESAAAANQLSGLYALAYLSPYTKMIWQFGELAYDYSIDYNDRTGRKPIPWTLGYFENTHRKTLYNNLSKIISWRTDHAEIFSYDEGNDHRKTWNLGESSKGGKTLVLSNSDGAVIVVANQTKESATTTVNVPQTGEWTNIITGQKVTLGSSYSVTLKAHEFVVLGKVN